VVIIAFKITKIDENLSSILEQEPRFLNALRLKFYTALEILQIKK